MLTFVDSAQTPVIHLIRAVEDDHILAESLAHVLDGLGLARPSRACRGTSHAHPQGLGQGDEASREDMNIALSVP